MKITTTRERVDSINTTHRCLATAKHYRIAGRRIYRDRPEERLLAYRAMRQYLEAAAAWVRDAPKWWPEATP